MEHGIAEGLSMAALSRRAGVSPEQISMWRLDIRAAYVTGNKSNSVSVATPPQEPIRQKRQEAPLPEKKKRMTREEKIEALEAQKRDGLTNREAAKRTGVSGPTWSMWRKELGYVAERSAKGMQELAKRPIAATVPASAAVSVRQVSITRPDGTRIEVSMTAEEIATLID